MVQRKLTRTKLEISYENTFLPSIT